MLPIQINGSGPYDFVVDTGAQVTTLDPSLAGEIGLRSEGTTGVGGVGTYGRASFAHVDLLQAGEQSVLGVLVVIQSVAQLTAADPLIRGILANNFLSHFDLLIDNRQRLLCLDKSGNSLSSHFRGERIALAEPYGQGGDMPFMRPILISARRSTEPDIPLILRLDSGSNVPVLYAPKQEVQERFTKKTKLLQRIVNGSEQVFEVLPAQDLK